MNQTIHNLLTEQLASWEMARNNYAALSGVQVKELNVNGIPYKVQFNPARIVSSGAKVDAKSIKERKSVSYISPSPDHTGNRPRRPTHSSPFRRYAGPGTATDRLYNLL